MKSPFALFPSNNFWDKKRGEVVGGEKEAEWVFFPSPNYTWSESKFESDEKIFVLFSFDINNNQKQERLKEQALVSIKAWTQLETNNIVVVVADVVPVVVPVVAVVVSRAVSIFLWVFWWVLLLLLLLLLMLCSLLLLLFMYCPYCSFLCY